MYSDLLNTLYILPREFSHFSLLGNTEIYACIQHLQLERNEIVLPFSFFTKHALLSF